MEVVAASAVDNPHRAEDPDSLRIIGPIGHVADPQISKLTFIPRAGFTGTVSIPYTATNADGTKFTLNRDTAPSEGNWKAR